MTNSQGLGMLGAAVEQRLESTILAISELDSIQYIFMGSDA